MKNGNMPRAAALILCSFMISACSSFSDTETGTVNPTIDSQPILLEYAEQFTADRFVDGSTLVTVGETEKYLLIPEGGDQHEEINAERISLPVKNVYNAAAAAMDMFLQLDSLECVSMTSTDVSDWSIPEIHDAVAEDRISYVGKYSSPDYEYILSENCGLAIESTMIYHSPETLEQLRRLGIPVFVERSSYESHPLGRLEWIKLYGMLTGREAEAEAFFNEKTAMLEDLDISDASGRTAAFFYISTSGYANVRKPGDYISSMIELAGGQYIFTADDLGGDENALSTMNMQMEAFYAKAKDADILIYNSTVDGELRTISQLLEKSSLLADFKAVKNGDVWCTEQNMYQQTTGMAEMISDFHAIISGEARDGGKLTYLHRLT
ncbi:MAG: ABC transporter substrate-binding protein [Huintestinicola sp.]